MKLQIPKTSPTKYPVTGRNNSDKTLLLHYISELLTKLGMPKCLVDFIKVWVNLIFQNTLRFIANKQHKVYQTVGDTLLNVIDTRCYDEKGNIKMSVITQRMIIYTSDLEIRDRYMGWFTPFLVHESWMEGIQEYIRNGIAVKVQSICEYLYHKKAWMSLTEIYIALMETAGRMELSFQMEPVETFDTIYRFLIMRLTLGCKRLAYRHAKHQDKLGIVKILMLWRNTSLLLSESRFLFPQLQSTYSITKHIFKRMDQEEDRPTNFPLLINWFCKRMKDFYNRDENMVDRKFVLYRLMKLYVETEEENELIKKTIEIFMK